MDYDSSKDTLKHISTVRDNIYQVYKDLYRRSALHDASKLVAPEKEVFDRITPKLKDLEYGSDEYKKTIREELMEGINHHYEVNDHHPEHWPNGIKDMSLMAIIEMICDWKAACDRNNGNFRDSLEINKERFQISDHLMFVIYNTCTDLEWI